MKHIFIKIINRTNMFTLTRIVSTITHRKLNNRNFKLVNASWMSGLNN